jgi:murein DD-endopeptidase MepM/ murein hydrolase activator NlpD
MKRWLCLLLLFFFTTGFTYQVQPGDTLWALAIKFQTTVNDIITWNNITNPSFIAIGQVLVIGERRYTRWPVIGPIFTYFSGSHRGIDISPRLGTPVEAVDNGVVIFADEDNGYGNSVIIEHANFTARYSHLGEVDVTAGQEVAAGDVIGNIGLTGKTTGPHLDFRIYIGGVEVDPLNELGRGN